MHSSYLGTAMRQHVAKNVAVLEGSMCGLKQSARDNACDDEGVLSPEQASPAGAEESIPGCALASAVADPFLKCPARTGQQGATDLCLA
jgi:hypothetical protein